MKALTHPATDMSSVVTSLATIRMSGLERRRAYVTLSNGKVIAELLLGAAANILAIARYVESAAVNLASGTKAMFVKPAKH